MTTKLIATFLSIISVPVFACDVPVLKGDVPGTPAAVCKDSIQQMALAQKEAAQLPYSIGASFGYSSYRNNFSPDQTKGESRLATLRIGKKVGQSHEVGAFYTNARGTSYSFISAIQARSQGHTVLPYYTYKALPWLSFNFFGGLASTGINLVKPTSGNTISVGNTRNKNWIFGGAANFVYANLSGYFAGLSLGYTSFSYTIKAYNFSDGTAVSSMSENYGSYALSAKLGKKIDKLIPYVDLSTDWDHNYGYNKHPKTGEKLKRNRQGFGYGAGLMLDISSSWSGGISYKQTSGHSSFKAHSGTLFMRYAF